MLCLIFFHSFGLAMVGLTFVRCKRTRVCKQIHKQTTEVKDSDITLIPSLPLPNRKLSIRFRDRATKPTETNILVSFLGESRFGFQVQVVNFWRASRGFKGKPRGSQRIFGNPLNPGDFGHILGGICCLGSLFALYGRLAGYL